MGDSLKSVKSPVWKRILWWTLAAFGVIGVIVLLVFLFRKKSPKEQVNEVINKAKAQIQKSEIEEKIKVAEARGEEKAVVDRLKEIRNIDDAHEQAKELEKLL
jgi:uncharacterized membrane protein YvbJ